MNGDARLCGDSAVQSDRKPIPVEAKTFFSGLWIRTNRRQLSFVTSVVLKLYFGGFLIFQISNSTHQTIVCTHFVPLSPPVCLIYGFEIGENKTKYLFSDERSGAQHTQASARGVRLWANSSDFGDMIEIQMHLLDSEASRAAKVAAAAERRKETKTFLQHYLIRLKRLYWLS